MSIDRRAGMTLIELVMAIVIISVGLAGVMAAFSTVVRGSADPTIRKQMLTIAEEMMEEISLKPFPATLPGPAPGCARKAFNDIFDYDNYNQPICDIDGTPIAALGNYSVTVNVVGDATLPSVTAANAAKITVTVSHVVAPSLKLIAWRTWYSCAAPAVCLP